MNRIALIFALALFAITVAAVTDAQLMACKRGTLYAIVGLCTPDRQPVARGT
jgi:hypothetical protein